MVFAFVSVIVSAGLVASLLFRTRRPELVGIGLVLASLVSYLRPGPGGHSITIFSAWAFALFWGCVGLERLRPRNPYPLVSAESVKSMTLMPFRAAALVLGSSVIVLPWQRGALPSLHWGDHQVPLVVQVVVATVVADFVIYWIHRAQHASSFYWKFHMPHHATRELSALANHRTNIVEMAVIQIGSRVAIFNLLGISATAAIACNLFAYTIAGTISHANVDFPSRPWAWLNYFIVTPNVHARHHALGQTAANFGETFTLWDLLFGTFAAPSEAMTFGIEDEAFTNKGLLEQHLHPFRAEAPLAGPSEQGAQRRPRIPEQQHDDREDFGAF